MELTRQRCITSEVGEVRQEGNARVDVLANVARLLID
jgi:hypothetical protein